MEVVKFLLLRLSSTSSASPSLLPLLLLLVTSLPDVADPASFMCAQCEALGEFLQMAKARVASLAHVARRKQGAKVSRKAFSKHRSIIT